MLMLNVGQDVLTAYPADEELPDADEAHSLMASLLPASSAVFRHDFFDHATFQVNVLRDVAKHYGFSDIDEEFLSLAELRHVHDEKTSWTSCGSLSPLPSRPQMLAQ